MAKGLKTGGRQMGSRNKHTIEGLRAAANGGMLPLQQMLNIMRDEEMPLLLRCDMAKAAAPYCHARLVSVEAKTEVNATVTHKREASAEITRRLGRLAPANDEGESAGGDRPRSAAV